MFNGHTKEVYLSFEGPVFADPVNKKDAYSISASRAKFRHWLTHDIEINWDHTFKSYEILSNGRVIVYFENGASAEGDILVGADGSQSKGIPSLALLGRGEPFSLQLLVSARPTLLFDRRRGRAYLASSRLCRRPCSLSFP